MNNLSIDKYSLTSGKDIALTADQTGDATSAYIDKLDFWMPMPVDTMKIKVLDVLVIITKRVVGTTVMGGFPHRFISKNTVNRCLLVHSLLLFYDIVQ